MKNSKEAITKQTGNRIRFLRYKKNLSQEELAFLANINPSYIGHIERGLKCPTIDTLNKICSALEISLSDFFDFNSENKKTKGEKITTLVEPFSEEELIIISNIISEISKLKKH